ncbi:MAG: type II toxin-antitoxin system VapC family toxin [Anaerolineae bacterium]|nr:type II toxin-antitoxin system VapC family toxin [Anaerolineae bacterium]
MAQFFVDTSVLIAHMRQKQPTVFQKAKSKYGDPLVSEIVVFELEVGARRAGRQREFDTHFAGISTYPLTQAVLLQAADLLVALVKQNQTIGALDTFIAATALHHQLPLFTLNSKHFQRVPNLILLSPP